MKIPTALLRQYFPRKTDLSGYSQSDLDKVALRLNQRPRSTRSRSSCSSIVGFLAIGAMPRVETEQIENVLLKESVTVPTFQTLTILGTSASIHLIPLSLSLT
jgi:hypothetical protein